MFAPGGQDRHDVGHEVEGEVGRSIEIPHHGGIADHQAADGIVAHLQRMASAGAQPIVPKVDAGHDRIGKRAQSRPDAAVGGQRCSRRPKT